MQHAGHITLAVNSARAISHEIFREDMLLPEQRDLLVAAMGRKRVEFGVAGIEVYSAKMETLTKSLDAEVPAGVLDLPIGQLVLQAINGKQETNTGGRDGQAGSGRRTGGRERSGKRSRGGGRGRRLRARIAVGQNGRHRAAV
jgi:two-component system nitrogen regulation sensor histidine kinase NtrY